MPDDACQVALVGEDRLAGSLHPACAIPLNRMADAHHGAFGQDAFGRGAEAAARFFGTPRYIVGQTLVVIAWIALNAAAIGFSWDPYPFILLNLAFSTQAAYAAPLILLAQTRQAERDRMREDAEKRHRDEVGRLGLRREEAVQRATEELRGLLQANTDLTQQDRDLTQRVEALTREIHRHVLGGGTSQAARPSDT